jgi:hypothetical protein
MYHFCFEDKVLAHVYAYAKLIAFLAPIIRLKGANALQGKSSESRTYGHTIIAVIIGWATVGSLAQNCLDEGPIFVTAQNFTSILLSMTARMARVGILVI